MAYDTSNPPRLIVDGSLLSGGAMWIYESLDVYAAVQVPGYISNAGAIGLKRGDIVINRCQATGDVTSHSVLYLAPSTKPWDNTPGAASLSQVDGAALSEVLTAGANADIVPVTFPMSAYATLGLSPSSGAATVSGMSAGAAGQVIVATNGDAVNSVTLLSHGSATPANDFSTAIVMPAGAIQLLVYQGALWTPLSPA